ncbi:MAG TPA: DUF2339 domain-containing protein [Burkholderiales bacterium]|nr:DUF2339 domain-containing protein [Burkholderiales bacterium]
MWFLGLMIGLVIGAVTEGGDGAVYGAAFGALAGYALRLALGRSTDARLDALEQDVRRLREALDAVRAAPPSQAVTAPRAEPFPEFELAAAPPGSMASIQIEPEPAPPEAAPAPAAAAPSAPTPPRPPPSAPQAGSQPPAWWSWLVGGNTVVRVGVVVLFFGVAFLLKYAYDHTHIPIQVRLIAVALGAVVLLVIGWRLRLRRRGYALALQGAGIGALYLTVFASFRLFGLLPSGAALVLLFFIAALSAALAVLQSSQSLAILGASGGFLAPVLTSTGGGSHVMLFSYYALLNAGILGIAWYKAWRPLNLVGFAFTFGIGTLWGAQYYRPELFASTQPFLALFFALYLAIPVLYARREAGQTERYLDAVLVFGVPVIAFGLQLRLVRGFEYGGAFSAVALSLVYLLLARTLHGREGERLRMLVEAFLALGVVFATLAIPLALDGRWTAAAWALEGAALVWVGVRQGRRAARAFGLLLQIGAGLAFLWDMPHATGRVPIFNSTYLGCLFVALAGLFSNWYLQRNRGALRNWEAVPAAAVFFWGLAWWVGGGLAEIQQQLSGRYEADAALLFFAGSAVALGWLCMRIGWRLALYPAFALLPVMALLAFGEAAFTWKRHPFAALGVIAWPAAFAAHYWLLRRFEAPERSIPEVLHSGAVWLLAALGAWELAWNIDRAVLGEGIWPLIAWVLFPGALLNLLSLWGQRIAWPVRAHLDSYLLLGCAPLAAFLYGWMLYANFTSNGNPAPLPYVPLANPLDLAQIAALLVILLWLREARALQLLDLTGERMIAVMSALGTVVFVAANGVLLRSLHHYADVPFHLASLWRSMLVQAALSIFWSLLALCTMAIATRIRVRVLWIVGATLMAVVVVKLFLVDLSGVSGVERIVSFIGVGLLMLVIGYLSPVPPRARELPQ